METKLWADLSDAQAEKVVGGVGYGGAGGAGAGFYGWFGGPNHMSPEDHKGLINAGFAAPGTLNANAAVDVGLPGSKS